MVTPMESAKNTLIKSWSGTKNLVESTVMAMGNNINNLYQACGRIASNTLPYVSQRREWCERRGIKTKNPDAYCESLFKEACMKICDNYLKTHNLAIVKRKSPYAGYELKKVVFKKGSDWDLAKRYGEKTLRG